jgi:hypothetical protein
MITSNQIIPTKQIYPYCILWSPIPLITWILPFVGHTGTIYLSIYLSNYLSMYVSI